MTGQLFTDYFLTAGIKATEEWRDSDTAFAAFRATLSARYRQFSSNQQPNEATTEQELIRPVLEALGWTDHLPQQGTTGNEDIPDNLLFIDAASKHRAAGRPNPQERYQDAAVVEESKQFGLKLDAITKAPGQHSKSPHSQILQYLSTAEIASESRIRWGFLTNGGVWRLYDQHARPRATGYFEADLGQLLDAGNADALRAFYLLFRRDSFTRTKGATTTFLVQALAEGRRYEEQVARNLSSVVFAQVFPRLITALASTPGATLPEARNAALIFLYRLLFVLYAEDRGLLPVNDERYEDYGLRKPVRDDIAHKQTTGAPFSSRASAYYDHLMQLWRLIDKGDPPIGLPPYNGGLFADEAAPLLARARLPDAVVAPIVYDLSHAETADGRRFVNYRDMSVQQLGSIYERLLEQEPVRADDGAIVIRPNSYARKDSGSFYTPQELVDLIVDRTLKPLAEERLRAFEQKAAALKRDHRPKSERLADLRKLDPAEAVLDLKVLDPAMGSGHFLVTAVDFLSDYIADLVESVPAVPDWLDGAGEYESPLVGRVAAIRDEIRGRARQAGWVIDEEAQLTDQAIIRRMVLKRCIYGVDKNPLTVELAKVSLWLHSFTVGAPLSFLDHHLRCGDSLVGLRVREARDELLRFGPMFTSSAVAGAEAAAAGMQRIEEMSDADISEVEESAALFQDVEHTTADLRGLLDFLTGMHWHTAGMKSKERATIEGHIVAALGADQANGLQLLAHGPKDNATTAPADGSSPYAALWQIATGIADRETFLHWEAAFPGVWQRWQEEQPQGGFDAVIGNPPWDRIKLQEVEWFATRSPELAHAPTAAARSAAIQRLRNAGAPLAAEFDAAKTQADDLGQLVRASGHYPLLGGGDINLYSLFVERAMSLVKPDGIVGLLTPSGIYADKTAADFFKSISTSGRVAGLFDFENKKIFFKDVHASFKFCALIFGGEERRFDETACAFFLHDTATIEDSDRCFPLAPADFARVNPNTATAPIFRTRRDAAITRGIYEHHPVLVDRSDGKEHKTWPVRFTQGTFHMANDSQHFRTAAQLEAAGFYPVQGNRWKRGNAGYSPLYQGRMIWQFDHRVSSVRVNPESTHNPYLSEEVSAAQHADPGFLPRTQLWVPADLVEAALIQSPGHTLAFRSIARPTDIRTMIASIVPAAGFGDTVSLLIGDDTLAATCLVANLNAMNMDFVTRQKAQSTHMSWYIVEQLPVIAPDGYDRRFGEKTAREIVRDHVLRLSYTAHDLAPFARDLGYDGPPFIWDEEARRHLRARLDALYFHLYGLSKDDAGYILGTFPIVQRQDEAAFGRYRTRELVLAYMNALAAGDTEAVVAV